ncbi:transglycosylase domain-containing protein [Terricaulis silvestris]|uniref:Penicillin-binding protein 2D n=1 Tax=Terricaulis silvestris TaxID=2686094 RepID=A0A6I6MK39_9CAUL|nr:PBP1A family penicillin-binding protein [Terricaulis silvestris]QGZ95590.1 Penicillin-binding protein 2D [Terricaulis silvestris]
MSDLPPDPRRGIDWAKLRAAAQTHAAAIGDRSNFTWRRIASFAAGGVLLFVLALWIWIYWGLPRVPDAEALWALNRQPSIMFVDTEGEIIGVRGPYYARRATLAELPEYVPQAFLAIEDRRFYQHEGVDRMAIFRAILANLRAGETVQGASTITQQLSRNLFLTPNQTINRKLREMVLASRIERRLTKDEILELYLNRVYLGDQAYGVDAAARRFFGKTSSELTLAEAAMLAGLPKAPSRSAPTESMERATARQHVVLDAMVEAGFITAEQAAEAKEERIRVIERPSTERAMGYAFDLAVEQARAAVGRDTPDLVIQMTIDRDVQEAAANSIRRRLGNRAFGRRPLQASMMAVNRQGAIVALVGGTDYNTSKFNRVTQAERQPGSTFKTFVYTAALEAGLDTEDVRYDEPVVIDGWRPRNYDDGYRGAVTLRTAFALSINTVAASVANEVSPRRVADVATRLGITDMPARGQFVPPSIALGSIETTLWDMTSAFAVFMNDGRRIDAHIIQSVSNSAGQLLYTRPPYEGARVLDEQVVQHMTSMMGAVVLRGTGTGASLGGRDVAGKTGTSSDWRDAWFVGYTADYTAGVWVGHDDFTSMGRTTGGTLPAQIWNDTMRVAHQGVEDHPLPGIEQPAYSPAEIETASFFDDLANAFGDSGNDLGDALEEIFN